MSVEAQFREWENRLAGDPVRSRYSEEHARSTVRSGLQGALKSIHYSMKKRRLGPLPRVSVDVLSLWDLTALVGHVAGGRYPLGVGLGTVFLLDAACSFLCALLFNSGSTRAHEAQKRLGTISYDYARARTYAIRHWMLDPTIYRVHPYGIIPVALSEKPPQHISEAHQFYLEVLVRWILGHEVAHIRAGHLEEQRSIAVLGMYSNDVTLSVARGRADQELYADFDALCTVLSIYPGAHSRVFTAISYFIGIMHIVDAISVRPSFCGPHHPSPLERIDSLISRLNDALPDLSNREIGRLSSIGRDFARVSKEIATDIVQAPQAYRDTPLIIEDYQEDHSENDVLLASARINDEGDALAQKGDLRAAIHKYVDAFERIADIRDWGDGHRIVLSNLIMMSAELGSKEECCRWTQRGVDMAIAHNDKPTLSWLAMLYEGSIRNYATRWAP